MTVKIDGVELSGTPDELGPWLPPKPQVNWDGSWRVACGPVPASSSAACDGNGIPWTCLLARRERRFA